MTASTPVEAEARFRSTPPSSAGQERPSPALLRSKTFLVGILIVGFWVFCAIFGELIAPHDPLQTSATLTLQAPSAYWFGTDGLGRDVFSRVLVGSRDIITVALLATILGTVAGLALGLVMGYFKGLVDEAISRIIEAFFALPVVIVALLALTALGPSNYTVIVVIGLVFTP